MTPPVVDERPALADIDPADIAIDYAAHRLFGSRDSDWTPSQRHDVELAHATAHRLEAA